MANIFEQYEIWWVTGAQLLYGGETVKIVDGHSREMVDGLNNSGIIPIKEVYKGTANSSKEAEAVMKAANNDEIAASKTYEFSIMDNVIVVKEV